jgi:hypothetical protein
MAGNIYTGGLGPLFLTPGTPNMNDPFALPPELTSGTWELLQNTKKAREALAQQRNNIGLGSWIQSQNTSAINRLFGRDVPTPLTTTDSDYPYNANQRKQREELELQIAVLDAKIKELETSQPYLAQMAQSGGDMKSAIFADYQRKIEQGVPQDRALNEYQAALVRLDQGLSAQETDYSAAAEAQSRIPTWGRPTATTAAAAGAIDPITGQPVAPVAIPADDTDTILAAQYPGYSEWTQERKSALKEAIYTSALRNLNGTPAPTAPNAYENALAEESRGRTAQAAWQLQQQQQDQAISQGLIGNIPSTGIMSPINIQDNLNAPGPLGQIAAYQLSQQAGTGSPYQLQQDARAQSQWDATMAFNQQQAAADQAYRQQSLAQAMQIQQMQLEQQRREMAARIGQAVADMANQSYMNTLGQRLPAGTTQAPGFQAGGPMSALASMSGIGYTPTPIAVANPPTTNELMATVQAAINGFQ